MNHYGLLSIDERATGGELVELKCFTCPHCNRVVTMNPHRSRPRHFCTKCEMTTCDTKFCIENCLAFVPILVWGNKHDRTQLEITLL